MICLVRVDDRLLHGQVIHAWVPFTGADMLVVVTDSDASALIEKDLSALASESGCEVRVITPDYA
ncbi:MAG: PTS sugar transporter subunit IIB, partial [Thermodesulfobacteriota bacterium]